MPKCKEIAVCLASMRAYPEERRVTTRQVAERHNEIFHFMEPIDFGKINRTGRILRHMEHSGNVSKEKAEKENVNLWQLTNSGRNYAEWWYERMKEAGVI